MHFDGTTTLPPEEEKYADSSTDAVPDLLGFRFLRLERVGLLALGPKWRCLRERWDQVVSDQAGNGRYAARAIS